MRVVAFAGAGRLLFGEKAEEFFSMFMMHFFQSLQDLAPYLAGLALAFLIVWFLAIREWSKVTLDRNQKEQDTNMKRIDADVKLEEARRQAAVAERATEESKRERMKMEQRMERDRQAARQAELEDRKAEREDRQAERERQSNKSKDKNCKMM